MSMRTRGLVVLSLQLAMVLSIAVKYAWERHTCPTVWTRTTQFDPDQPLRGRYLALQLRANACELIRKGTPVNSYQTAAPGVRTTWNYDTKLTAQGGELVALPLAADRPTPRLGVTVREGDPCQAATLSETTDFFIPEHGRTPFPLAKGQELWALVTVPPSGPPRPVRLAVSDGTGFHVLDLR
jgi:hypothetical protein